MGRSFEVKHLNELSADSRGARGKALIRRSSA